MTGLLAVILAVGTALVAVGLYDLQNHLERWDHNRHAED